MQTCTSMHVYFLFFFEGTTQQAEKKILQKAQAPCS